jgi:hypothetical protein
MPSGGGDVLNDSPLVDDASSSLNDGRGFKLYVEQEDSEMEEDDSEEEHDQVMMDSPNVSAHNFESFRQLDYLWLFDPYLQFQERPEFQTLRIDESSLSLDDYA